MAGSRNPRKSLIFKYDMNQEGEQKRLQTLQPKKGPNRVGPLRSEDTDTRKSSIQIVYTFHLEASETRILYEHLALFITCTNFSLRHTSSRVSRCCSRSMAKTLEMACAAHLRTYGEGSLAHLFTAITTRGRTTRTRIPDIARRDQARTRGFKSDKSF